MRKRRTLTKQIGVMFSAEDYNLIELITQKDQISMSEYIRSVVEDKLKQILNQEENLWNDMTDKDFEVIFSSLIDYIKSNLPRVDEQYVCMHKYQLFNDAGDNFKYTKTFCKEVNIIFEPFKKRIDRQLGSVGCDCQILEASTKINNTGGIVNE